MYRKIKVQKNFSLNNIIISVTKFKHDYDIFKSIFNTIVPWRKLKCKKLLKYRTLKITNLADSAKADKWPLSDINFRCVSTRRLLVARTPWLILDHADGVHEFLRDVLQTSRDFWQHGHWKIDNIRLSAEDTPSSLWYDSKLSTLCLTWILDIRDHNPNGISISSAFLQGY